VSAALAGLAALVLGVVIWAGYVGVRSSEVGPAWALRHLRRVSPGLLLITAAGVLLAIWLEPEWLGLAVLYVGLVTFWIVRRVIRGLKAAERLGGFDPLPNTRRAALLHRVSRGLLLAGLVLVVLSSAFALWRGWVGAIGLLPGLALLVPGLLLGRRALRLQPPEQLQPPDTSRW